MIKKFFKFVLTTIKVLFFVVLFLYLAFVLTQRFTNNGSVFGYRIFTVASGSMRGVYEINDVIAIKDIDSDKLKVGDDVAYRGEKDRVAGKLIIHRIVKIEKDKNGKKLFYTKGVNAEIVDPAIEARQILGKCIGIVPVLTQLNHALNTKTGFILIAVCPLLFLISLEIWEVVNEKKKKKQLIGEENGDDTVTINQSEVVESEVKSTNSINGEIDKKTGESAEEIKNNSEVMPFDVDASGKNIFNENVGNSGTGEVSITNMNNDVSKDGLTTDETLTSNLNTVSLNDEVNNNLSSNNIPNTLNSEDKEKENMDEEIL